MELRHVTDISSGEVKILSYQNILAVKVFGDFQRVFIDAGPATSLDCRETVDLIVRLRYKEWLILHDQADGAHLWIKKTAITHFQAQNEGSRILIVSGISFDVRQNIDTLKHYIHSP